MRRKEKLRSKQGQTNNKAKQHSTPKAVTFLKKNELPRVHGTSTQTHNTLHSRRSALRTTYIHVQYMYNTYMYQLFYSYK